jgi:hypothetical protein
MSSTNLSHKAIAVFVGFFVGTIPVSIYVYIMPNNLALVTFSVRLMWVAPEAQ